MTQSVSPGARNPQFIARKAVYQLTEDEFRHFQKCLEIRLGGTLLVSSLSLYFELISSYTQPEFRLLGIERHGMIIYREGLGPSGIDGAPIPVTFTQPQICESRRTVAIDPKWLIWAMSKVIQQRVEIGLRNEDPSLVSKFMEGYDSFRTLMGQEIIHRD